MHRPDHTARVIVTHPYALDFNVIKYRAECDRCGFCGPWERRQATASLQATLHRCGNPPIVAVEA